MKQTRAQNVGVNFLSSEAAGEMSSFDPASLWAVRASVISEYWEAVDGKSWYRRHSDGWLEQGGILDVTNLVVTLPAAFADDNYTLVTGFTGLTSSSSTNRACTQAGMKTATSFGIRSHYSSSTIGSYPADWMAFGVGA